MNIEDVLLEFLDNAKDQRDYSSAHASAMKKVVKSTYDLIRNMEKVKQIDCTYGKESE